MKKLILPLWLLMLAANTYGQQVTLSEPIPKYGCPNVAHDIIIGVTNNSGISVPAGAVTYNMLVEIYDDATPTPGLIQSITNGYTDGFANGATKNYTLSNIAFTGAMTCSIAVQLTATGIPIIGNISYNNSSSYIVQYPPDLTITESPTGTIAVINAASQLSTNYLAHFFWDGNYASEVHESSGTYVTTADGSYTAKAYDPESQCYSVNPSNAIVISTVANTKDGQLANVSVYPNPISNNVTISSELTNTLQYELSDINGAVLKNAEFTSVTDVSVENLNAGTYFLKVKDQNNKTTTYKLVK